METREVPKFILCPDCNEKYNDVNKRRVIDSCGHPRCFTCLCKNSVCPQCTRSRQLTGIGAQSPDGCKSNGYLRWQARSGSVSGNKKQRLPTRDFRSKSLMQLSARNASQTENSRTSEKENETILTDTPTDSSNIGTVDNPVGDIIETRTVGKEKATKIDRKMSFSSVLNRNSESYKQSRYRRASSFSFIPKDTSTIDSGEMSSFESKLKIRNRPKSLVIGGDERRSDVFMTSSPLHSDGCEGKDEPARRRSRLDSVVRMAAAWLEESKSDMQHKYFASESFRGIQEENLGAENDDCLQDIESKEGEIIADQSVGPVNKHRDDSESSVLVELDVEDDSKCVVDHFGKLQSEVPGQNGDECDFKLLSKEDPVRDDCNVTNVKNEESLAIGMLPQDADHDFVDKKDICNDVSAPLSDYSKTESKDHIETENVPYLFAVRGLLKELGQKKETLDMKENIITVKNKCLVESGTTNADNKDSKRKVDADSKLNSSRRHGTCVNPLHELERRREFKPEDVQFDQNVYKEERPDFTVEGSRMTRASDTHGFVRAENRLLNSESSVIDTNGNDQQAKKPETNSKTNISISCLGLGSFCKQSETSTLAGSPLREVPKDVEKRNSCCSVRRVSKDHFTFNELQSREDITQDIFTGSYVKRPTRSRSLSCKGEIKVTMTEIHFIPSLKNRRRRPSSVGSFKSQLQFIDQMEGIDVDAYSGKMSVDASKGMEIVSSSPNDTGEALSEQCSSSPGKFDEPENSGHNNDKEINSDKTVNEMEELEALETQSGNNLERGSSLADTSIDLNSRLSTHELNGSQNLTTAEVSAESILSASKLSLGTEESSNVSQMQTEEEDLKSSCDALSDRVEEILSNKTDDWKTANFHILHCKAESVNDQCNESLEESIEQNNEVPVVFVNGEDFHAPSFKEEGQNKKLPNRRKTKERDKKCKSHENGGFSQNHGIGFIREKFQQFTKWSKRGAATEQDKGKVKGGSQKKSEVGRAGQKAFVNEGFSDCSSISYRAKNTSQYDANRNVVMSSEFVRELRRRKFEKHENASLKMTNNSGNEATVKKLRGNSQQCEPEKRHSRQTSDGKQLLASNKEDEASLTTVSTLMGAKQYDDSDSDSSIASANNESEDSDSSDSTIGGQIWHSSYSTSSETINESIEEREMPDFRSSSRIQDNLTALFERKLTRKRLGLEEIDFHPLMPATKGKALVSRDWLYERFHGLLTRKSNDEKRVLLISGSHGCGKTTLLKSLIWSDCISHGKKRLHERISKSILSFHFCSKADARTTSVAKFILNFAARLVENDQFAAFTRSISESDATRSKLSCEAAEKFPVQAFREGLLKPLVELCEFDTNQGPRRKQFLILVDSLDHECKNCEPTKCINSLLASNVSLLPPWATLVVAGTKESLQSFNKVETDKINLENVANWDIQGDLYSFTEMELPIVTSQVSQSKLQKLVDNIVRFSRGSFQAAHMSIQYLSTSFASSIHQPMLHSLNSSKLVGHLFKMKFCATERNRILALSLLDVLLVTQELLTVSNLFKVIENSCTSQSISFQEYESCLTKLLDLQLVADSTEGRIFLNDITREWIQSSDGLKTGFNPSKGHNLLSVYYMKTLTRNEGKYVYLLAYHLSQSNFGEDITDKEKRVSFLAWTLNQVFKITNDGFMQSCNIYRPVLEVYHLFLHTELDMKAFERRYGSHPIVFATSLKQSEIVALLLEHDKYEQDNLHQALEEASKVGCVKTVDLLLAHTLKPCLVKPRDEGTSKSCVDIALEYGQLQVAVKLIAFQWKDGCNGSAEKNMAAQRVLCEACLHGRIDIVEELIAGGYISDVDTLDGDGNSPLVLAASKNQLIVAKYLIENKGNVDALDGQGLTPLLAATKNSHTETSEWLISQDANVNAEDKDGRTALFYAAASDMSQLIHSLFMEGASINHQDHNGLGALSIASKNGCKEAVKVLLRNRALVDISDKHSKTPLHYACQSQNLKLLQLLLDNGANINRKNGKGLKPLEIAFKEGKLDIAALLLRNGAHVGRSAVNIAEGNLGSLLCLVSHLEQRGNIMIKAGKYADANDNFQRALNIIENSKHRSNKRVIRIKLLCQQDARKKFI